MDSLLTLHQFATFLAASLLITLAPGPDILMVMSLAMARGTRRGIAFGLGCAAGCLNHTMLAALGVSALIAASQPAFTALRIAGGLYLLWLGIQAWRHARPLTVASADAVAAPLPIDASAADTPTRLFRRGLFANAINPKVVLFFLAFLPQFVAADHPAPAQIALLGLVFTLQAALVFAAIGWLAGRCGERLFASGRLAAYLDRVAGGIFMLVGAKILVGR
jgi:threonine/homoserine/homoserine lactone efflux protein